MNSPADCEQWEVQGRAPPRAGRRRAGEDVVREPDRAVPRRRRRAGAGAGAGRAPGPGVPGRQVQGLHGAPAEQQARREGGAGHRSRAACVTYTDMRGRTVQFFS